MGGDNQLDKSSSNLGGLQDELLGPDYSYSAQIRSPSDMGMSSAGDFGTLADDIGGLMAYVEVLVTGRGKASTTRQPLGTKFFLPTIVSCTDKASGNSVARSIYINNVPDGTIPFISQGMGGASFSDTEMEGLLPGIMSNLAQINPLQILQSFTNGGDSACQAITMETIDANNKHGVATAFVTNSDIDMMNSAWFASPGQTSKPSTKESFMTLQAASAPTPTPASDSSSSNLKGSPIDYSRMPNDYFIKIYLSSLGLLGLYIFLKMMLRRRLE